MSRLWPGTLACIAALTVAVPTEASAQWRGWGHRGVAYHGGWANSGYRQPGRNWGAPLAAGIIGGLAVGALASQPYYGGGYGYQPYATPSYVYDQEPYAYGYQPYSYGYQPYSSAYRPRGLTRNSSCSDVRANPSLYSENIWRSCGVGGYGAGDWRSSTVR